MQSTLASLIALLGAGLLLGSASPPARAALGEPVSSVSTDQARMKGQLRARTAIGYTVEEITLPSGTVIKEFVSPAGLVFAVSWHGPVLPDLAQTLGAQYFSQLTAAEKAQRRGHSHAEVRSPTLVVHSGGHMRAFFGMAYVPSLLPANLNLSDLH